MSQEEQSRRVRWEIPRNVWIILWTWGAALIMLAGLSALRLELNQREADKENREQDAAMCEVVDIIISGPTPPAGPAGQRSRDVLAKMIRYRTTLHCPGR